MMMMMMMMNSKVESRRRCVLRLKRERLSFCRNEASDYAALTADNMAVYNARCSYTLLAKIVDTLSLHVQMKFSAVFPSIRIQVLSKHIPLYKARHIVIYRNGK